MNFDVQLPSLTLFSNISFTQATSYLPQLPNPSLFNNIKYAQTSGQMLVQGVAGTINSAISLVSVVASSIYSNFASMIPVELENKIRTAKVVILMENHLNESHRLYNRAIVQKLCSQSDLLLVEEDCAKGKKDLTLEQLPGLDRSAYNVRGWVPTAICKQGEALKEEIRKIRKAIQGIEIGAESHKKGKYYKRLGEFSTMYGLSYVREMDQFGPGGVQEFEVKKQKMLEGCKKLCKELPDKLTFLNFPIMQAAMIKTLDELKKNASIGRIFIDMGTLHVDSKLLESLHDVSYVVCDQPNESIELLKKD